MIFINVVLAVTIKHMNNLKDPIKLVQPLYLLDLQ